MALLIRHTVVWTGAPGLPGYSQFYQEVTGSLATDAQDGHDWVRAMFNGLGTLIPDGVDVTVDPVYQALDIATGEITSEGTVATPSAVVSGAYVSSWSAQVGVLVEWTTATYIAGRRLRGRTYLVPLGNVGDSDGTLSAGTLATVAAAADSIVSGTGNFGVWHRPVAGAGGSLSGISGAVVRDKAAVLRSRML